MGLIKAGMGAIGGTLADQWLEFFYCDALANDVLVVKGKKRTSGRSSNTRGNDNVITNGSGIAVANGQCMIIVDQGKIVEFCAEPGEYTYNTSSEPSIFTGDLGDGIKQAFLNIGKRFAYGGDAGKDQRVYYFNTKEIMDNKFGTPNPFMFDVVNKEIGIRRTVQVRCNGVYSYKITNPILFYSEVCGNVEQEFTKDEIEGQLKTEFIDALQPAFAALSELQLRPAQIPAHANELKDAMNNTLRNEWSERRGYEEDQSDGRRRFYGKQSIYDGRAHDRCNCSCNGKCRIQSERLHERILRYGNGNECRRRYRRIPSRAEFLQCRSSAAGGTAGGKPSGSGKAAGSCDRHVEMQLRCSCKRQILPGMRDKEAGTGACRIMEM